ncbi:hypothetical protein Q3G72_034926 [Acer saccharum]|nr:hypothetical protein Q3G72_034926 [Acer saccharum]
METNTYHDKALQHIEPSHMVYYSDEELPLNLKIRAGICHIHLGNMEKSEVFGLLVFAGFAICLSVCALFAGSAFVLCILPLWPVIL